MNTRPPPSTLFPYTTLFRSVPVQRNHRRPGRMVRPTPSADLISRVRVGGRGGGRRSEEYTSELQSQFHLVCRLLLEKKKIIGNEEDSKRKKQHKNIG